MRGLFLFNFRPFHITIQFEKADIVVLGIWTQVRTIVGENGSTELWLCFYFFMLIGPFPASFCLFSSFETNITIFNNK